MRITLFLSLLCAFFIVPSLSYAVEFDETLSYRAEEEKEIEKGVKMGEMIPHDLSISDHRGRVRTFKELSGRNGLVLYFMRSAIWSPYCIHQLREISERGRTVEDVGYNIVILSYDTIRKLSIFAKDHKFPYTMLSDKHSEVIRAFGLLNDEFDPGTTYYGVPHPAAYVIGHDGKILHKFYNKNFKLRPTISHVRDVVVRLGEYKPVVEYHQEYDRKN